MASLIKLGVTALAGLALVVGNAGLGWAGFGCAPCTVKINDLTETPTVQLFDGPTNVSGTLFFPGDNNPAGEFLHFTFSAFSPAPFAPVSVYSDLFEDHLGGTLSDRLVLTLTPALGLMDVKFASDPATVAIPDGATHGPDFVENGDFQTLFSVADPFSGRSVQFQVASDVDPVPAPATLLLLGSGLAGLGAVGWRRKRG